MKSELEELHEMCSYNSADISRSSDVGCFHCIKIYPSLHVREWIDGGKTALCAECGVDSLLAGGKIGISIPLLKRMHTKYFDKVMTSAEWEAEDAAKKAKTD